VETLIAVVRITGVGPDASPPKVDRLGAMCGLLGIHDLYDLRAMPETSSPTTFRPLILSMW